jgi:hypothetical protein
MDIKICILRRRIILDIMFWACLKFFLLDITDIAYLIYK